MSDKSVVFRFVPRGDPAGSGSAPQTPNTFPEPSPDRTKIDPCGACPPYPEPNPEHAIIRIPLGFVQPRKPQTHSLNLLRIEPKLMPAVHVRHTHSPIRNMQQFESRAGTKKASICD